MPPISQHNVNYKVRKANMPTSNQHHWFNADLGVEVEP